MKSRRSDIDILRALAVLSVVLYHFDVSVLSGGFLGVDIFFVISGYLITLHLRQQATDGSFSFINFYARRIRRLFPALAATLLLTSVGALLLLPESLLTEFSHSAIASSAYVSNIYFWSIADYFDTSSIYKPLLHTWSLSVEEQFYIFWPIFIILFTKRNLNASIFVIGIVSLLAGLTFNFSQTTVFYQFPFRVFEFAAGALVSGISLSRLPRWAATFLLTIAFSAIVYGLISTTELSAFPGWGSGAVVLGTAVIIAVAHPALKQDFWVYKPILRIGLTSYSAYLVHWPLVVFYKVIYPGPLSTQAILLLLGLTFLMAELFYRLVEQPTLRLSLPRFRYQIIAMAPLILVFALIFNQTQPLVKTFIINQEIASKEQITLDQLLKNTSSREEWTKLAMEKFPYYPHTPTTQKKKIVILGDSHSIDVYFGLYYNLPENMYDIKLIHSICDPLTGKSITSSIEDLYESHYQQETHGNEYCAPYHKNLIDEIGDFHPDIVIFSEAWRAEAFPYLPATIEEIQSVTTAKIVLLGRTPQFVGDPGVLYRDIEDTNEINKIAWERRYKIFDDFDKRISKIAKDTNSVFVSKTDIVCPAKVCDIVIGDELGYTDTQHWSYKGMQIFGQRLENDPVFKQALSN